MPVRSAGKTVNEGGKLLVTTHLGEYLVSRGRRFDPVQSKRPYPLGELRHLAELAVRVTLHSRARVSPPRS